MKDTFGKLKSFRVITLVYFKSQSKKWKRQQLFSVKTKLQILTSLFLTKFRSWSCIIYSPIAFKATTHMRNAMKTDSSMDLHFVKEALQLHL